jgi:hypothetical protein
VTNKSDVDHSKSISNAAAKNHAVIWTIGSKRNANSNAECFAVRRRARKEIHRKVVSRRESFKSQLPFVPPFVPDSGQCKKTTTRKEGQSNRRVAPGRGLTESMLRHKQKARLT